MSNQSEVAQILRGWSGEDAASRRDPRDVAQQIDSVYQDHLAELDKDNKLISAGQQAWQEKVA